MSLAVDFIDIHFLNSHSNQELKEHLFTKKKLRLQKQLLQAWSRAGSISLV